MRNLQRMKKLVKKAQLECLFPSELDLRFRSCENAVLGLWTYAKNLR
jgi:hypothetical protein